MPSITTAKAMPENAIIARVVRVVLGSHALGWSDQAVVSATSFALLVMIGRWTNPAELGVYAVGASIFALLSAVQDSLITRPYAIHLHQPSGTSEDHAFGALSLSVVFSAGVVIATAIAGLLLFAFDSDHQLSEIAWVIAGTIPFVLMREFARRFSFAHLAVAQALLLDCAVAILTIFAVVILARFGRLSAASALAMFGIVCGLGGCGWLCLIRREFSWSFRNLLPTLQRSWKMGKWFLSSQLAMQLQSYMTPWLALVFAGAAATGVYAACASIVAFANPLLFGFFNVLLPKFVRTLRHHGLAALRRQAYFDAVVLACIMGLLSFIIFAYGDEIMRLLYRGEAYSSSGDVLLVLTAASLAAAVGAPAAIALAAAEHARSVACVTVLTAVFSLGMILALLPTWGLLGAAYGILIAEIAGSLGRWAAFLLLLRDGAAPDIKSANVADGRSP